MIVNLYALGTLIFFAMSGAFIAGKSEHENYRGIVQAIFQKAWHGPSMTFYGPIRMQARWGSQKFWHQMEVSDVVLNWDDYGKGQDGGLAKYFGVPGSPMPVGHSMPDNSVEMARQYSNGMEDNDQ